jgi:signal transduction histidine kinase
VFLAVFLAASTVSPATKETRFIGTGTWLPQPAQPPQPVQPLPALPGLPPAPPAARFPQLADHLGRVVAVPIPLWVLVLAALTALPLAVRRRYPLAAFWSVIGATLAFHRAMNPLLLGADDSAVFTFVSCLIAAYSAASYSPYRRRTVWSLAAGTALILAFHGSTIPAIAPGFVPFLLLIPAGLAANTIHSWRQRVRTLEAEHETATRHAVEQERARIARELHDVVTHNVSMMTVQAGAARKVMATAPELAAEALLAVEAGGRAAMSELRHVMGLLTMSADPDDPASVDLAPQPGLGQIAVLAGRVRDTGVPVELVVSGTPLPLPPGVELAAYRVVQEALTNTVKHAAGAAVTIRVEHDRDEVRIEVTDTGGASDPAASGGNGRGLIGLRERLAVYGGTLDAGRRISGGYRVRAVIPVGDG